MKPIEFSSHALEQMGFRGTAQQEVIEAIRGESWLSAKLGRKESRKVYPYGKLWKNKPYEWKTVNPVFVEEADKIVVVTVYVFYGRSDEK